MDVVRAIEKVGSQGGATSEKVVIKACGELSEKVKSKDKIKLAK